MTSSERSYFRATDAPSTPLELVARKTEAAKRPRGVPKAVIDALSIPKTVRLPDQPVFDIEEYEDCRQDFLEINLRLNLNGWPCPSFRGHAPAPSPKYFGGSDTYPTWARDYASDLKLIDLHWLHAQARHLLTVVNPLLREIFANPSFDFAVAHEWLCQKLHNKLRVDQLGLSTEQQHWLSAIKCADVRRRANLIDQERPQVGQAIRRAQRLESETLGGVPKIEHYLHLYRILHFVNGNPTAAAKFYPFVTGQPVCGGAAESVRSKVAERRNRLSGWCARNIDEWTTDHTAYNRQTKRAQVWHAEQPERKPPVPPVGGTSP